MKDEKERKRKRKEEKKAQKKQKREAEALEQVLQRDEQEDLLKNKRARSEEEAEAAPHDVVILEKKKDKKKKSTKKDKKKNKRKDRVVSTDDSNSETEKVDDDTNSKRKQLERQKENEHKALTSKPSQLVESSAIEFFDDQMKQQKPQEQLPAQKNFAVTLLLFYQYVEPVWDEKTYNFMFTRLQKVGKDLQLTGRMRVAKEGLNCTLTGTHESIVEYCQTLRRLRAKEFASTEFKLTSNLPQAQKFPNLKVFKVVELVHYGLEGSKAPPIAKFSGTHLEPKDYHKKLGESNTVVIDVRNHYEAAIGRFIPPSKGKGVKNGEAPPKWLDPKMRKSTEFPAWLDRPEIMAEMKGKQVLMYCTGGIRCERASALLKYKMETDSDIKNLNIQGVYQLQGGIDKYFKEFPDGGYWKGKNYVFDKRFSHAPPKIDGELHGTTEDSKKTDVDIMGKCESCEKPWDMYRGKRRCPTCGVPSLICRDCFLADKEGRKKLGNQVRCDLCVEQGITSKHELRQKGEQGIYEYEKKMAKKELLKPDALAPNPDKVTRLHLKNMCRKNMDERSLCEAVPGVTHIVWRTDRKSDTFLGQGWVEMATPDDAARAILRDGKLKPFGRPLYISYQPPDGKDLWPPPNSKIILGMSRDDPVDEQQQQDDEEDPVLEQEEEEDEIGRNSSHYHDGDRSIPKKDHVEVEERSTCPITTVIGSTSTTNENEHVEEEERRWRLWVVSWGVYS